MSEWVRHAIWWQVCPLGAVGAEREALPTEGGPIPRLKELHGWLPHLLSLGCNGLALGPVFESATHGYDTVDHFGVDRRLGTDDDLTELIEACHAAGIRVLLDGVFNHVGRDFPRFRETYWCDRGVDAWRLDAAYAVPPAFWREVLPRVRERHPDVWVVGEVLHGDYAGYVAESGIDSVTQYELWKAVWSSLNDGNLVELAHALGRHGERRRHPWLAAARIEEPDELSNDVLAVRLTGEGNSLAVVLNVGDDAAEVGLTLSAAEVVAAGGTLQGSRLRVPAHDYALVAGS